MVEADICNWSTGKRFSSAQLALFWFCWVNLICFCTQMVLIYFLLWQTSKMVRKRGTNRYSFMEKLLSKNDELRPRIQCGGKTKFPSRTRAQIQFWRRINGYRKEGTLCHHFVPSVPTFLLQFSLDLVQSGASAEFLPLCTGAQLIFAPGQTASKTDLLLC